jgi:hypothetical protein
MGFEPATPVFEPSKTVHALDRTATVIGLHIYYSVSFPLMFFGHCGTNSSETTKHIILLGIIPHFDMATVRTLWLEDDIIQCKGLDIVGW